MQSTHQGVVAERDPQEPSRAITGLHLDWPVRIIPHAVQFVKGFFDAGRPIAVICHGPWILVEAGVVRGLTMTSYPSVKTDLKNAGALWVDEEVVIDRGIISSRTPADLPPFIGRMIAEFVDVLARPRCNVRNRRPDVTAAR